MRNPHIFRGFAHVFYFDFFYERIIAVRYKVNTAFKQIMEGSMASVACLAEGAIPCPRASSCQTLPLWAEFDKMTHDFFYCKHLNDLIRK